MSRLVRLIISGLFGIVSFGIYSSYEWLPGVLTALNIESNAFINLACLSILSLLTGLIVFFISSWVLVRSTRLIRLILRLSQHVPLSTFIIGGIGAVFGLIIGTMLSVNLTNIPIIGPFMPLTINVLTVYFSSQLFVGKSDEIRSIFTRRERERGRQNTNLLENADLDPSALYQVTHELRSIRSKILDTSVIIDGRILDICSTGFIEGSLIVPTFVLEELRMLADLSDTTKRLRGRRGLDILKQMQQIPFVEVQIMDTDFSDETEVDDKLIRLTQQLDGKLLTLDYNLSKICSLRNVAVLNINELANALRSVLLPGEEVSVTVVKPGKEPGQGVAYLDDGTMIVVEGASRLINQTITVTVTSALQTAAGRMIFAKC